MKGYVNEVCCGSPTYFHPDFRVGSLGGAICSLLSGQLAKSKVVVGSFTNAQGELVPIETVRVTLSSKKVKSILRYDFKTRVTDSGIEFTAIGAAKF